MQQKTEKIVDMGQKRAKMEYLAPEQCGMHYIPILAGTVLGAAVALVWAAVGARNKLR